MASCCLSQMFCSLRSQIFFTVRIANRQESRTKMMQLEMIMVIMMVVVRMMWIMVMLMVVRMAD